MKLTFGEAGFLFQTGAFLRKPLLDHVLNGRADLYKIGRGHGFRFKGLSAHSCATFPD
jgi:hypothetical protein